MPHKAKTERERMGEVKVQWQLIDIETRETVATLGNPFDGYPFDIPGEAIEKDLDFRYIGTAGIVTLVGALNATKT